MSRTTLAALWNILVFSFCLNTPAALAATQDDHPLISRYEGSVLTDKKVAEFNEYKLITGRSAKGDFDGETINGKVTRIEYKNPAARSTLEIFGNYQKAFEAAGVTTLYTCALDECGPAYSRSAWGRYNGLTTATSGDPRYLSGKLTKDGDTVYVALMVV